MEAYLAALMPGLSNVASISGRMASGVCTHPRLSCLRIPPADNNDAVGVIDRRRCGLHLLSADGARRNAYSSAVQRGLLLEGMAALLRNLHPEGLLLVAYASESAATLPWQTNALMSSSASREFWRTFRGFSLGSAAEVLDADAREEGDGAEVGFGFGDGYDEVASPPLRLMFAFAALAAPTGGSAAAVAGAEEVHHGNIDVPLARDRLAGVGKRRQIGRRTKLWGDGELRNACGAVGGDDFIPPFEMGLKCVVPLRSPWVAHLRPVFPTNPRVDMPHCRQERLDDIVLVLQKSLANIAPVGHVEDKAKGRHGSEEFGRSPWRVQAASAVGFVVNRDAGCGSGAFGDSEHLLVFRQRKKVSSRVAVDEEGLESGSMPQPFLEKFRMPVDVSVFRHPVLCHQCQSGFLRQCGGFISGSVCIREPDLNSVVTGILNAGDKFGRGIGFAPPARTKKKQFHEAELCSTPLVPATRPESSDGFRGSPTLLRAAPCL